MSLILLGNTSKQYKTESFEFSHLRGKGAGLFIYTSFGQSLVECCWGGGGGGDINS